VPYPGKAPPHSYRPFLIMSFSFGLLILDILGCPHGRVPRNMGLSSGFCTALRTLLVQVFSLPPFPKHYFCIPCLALFVSICSPATLFYFPFPFFLFFFLWSLASHLSYRIFIVLRVCFFFSQQHKMSVRRILLFSLQGFSLWWSSLFSRDPQICSVPPAVRGFGSSPDLFPVRFVNQIKCVNELPFRRTHRFLSFFTSLPLSLVIDPSTFFPL